MVEPDIIAPESPPPSEHEPSNPAWVSSRWWIAVTPWQLVTPIALFLLTVAAFLPAVMAEFVYWDDDDLLLGAMTYRTLDWDSLRWMVTTSYAGHFQPLTWLSYWLDWALWKREIAGYHLTSVLLHAGTALIFYFLVKRLVVLFGRSSRVGGSQRTSAPSALEYLASGFSAALFAIHPLRVESVAWLAERRDVLSGFFFVACIASYVRWQSGESGLRSTRGWYWLALVFQFLSLLAKASAVSIPVVLLILDVFPLRRLDALPWKRRFAKLVWDKTPFLVLAVAAGIRAWVAQVEAGAMYPLVEHDALSRAAQALYGLSFYVWKTLIPLHLGPLYQIPRREVLMGAILWKGIVGSVILVALAIACRKRLPAFTAAVAAYVMMILPVSGVFQSGPQLVADRYSYLACLGFAVLPAAGLQWFVGTSAWRKRNTASVLVLACAVALTALFYATSEQTKKWSSALELWQHAVTISPESSIVHTNLADALLALPPQRDTIRDAARHYQRALEIEPRDAIAAHHFGDALSAMGRDQEAEAMYLHSLNLDPGRPRVFISLAQLWIAKGQPHRAAEFLRDRMQRAPYDLVAAAFLAEMLATHPDADIRDGCEASELAARVSLAHEHKNAVALLTLASALAEDGQWNEAISTARAGQRLADKFRMEKLSEEFQFRIGLFRQETPYHYGD